MQTIDITVSSNVW